MTRCQHSHRACVSLGFILVLSTAIAIAQSTLGTIVGRIIDPSGAGIAGVKITLRNEATNVVNSQDASAQGEYVFSNIKPGIYQLTFEANGFAPHTVDHLALEVNQTVRQDVTLQLGTVSSSVQVTAEHTLVQTDTSSVGSVIESTQVQRMP